MQIGENYIIDFTNPGGGASAPIARPCNGITILATSSGDFYNTSVVVQVRYALKNLES